MEKFYMGVIAESPKIAAAYKTWNVLLFQRELMILQ